MRKITYYVATSLDGYICGENEDISGFHHYEDAVERYFDDLKNYDTTIMGRKTYEFGYKYGLEPGQPAYEHMEHYIFSEALTFDNRHPKVHVRPLEKEFIENLKNQEGKDIYLCGGGEFAGWMLQNQYIDKLKIKLNPFIQGSGLKLFGNTKMNCRLKLISKEGFQKGLQILEYQILYD